MVKAVLARSSQHMVDLTAHGSGIHPQIMGKGSSSSFVTRMLCTNVCDLHALRYALRTSHAVELSAEAAGKARHLARLICSICGLVASVTSSDPKAICGYAEMKFPIVLVYCSFRGWRVPLLQDHDANAMLSWSSINNAAEGVLTPIGRRRSTQH